MSITRPAPLATRNEPAWPDDLADWRRWTADHMAQPLQSWRGVPVAASIETAIASWHDTRRRWAAAHGYRILADGRLAIDLAAAHPGGTTPNDAASGPTGTGADAVCMHRSSKSGGRKSRP